MGELEVRRLTVERDELLRLLGVLVIQLDHRRLGLSVGLVNALAEARVAVRMMGGQPKPHPVQLIRRDY